MSEESNKHLEKMKDYLEQKKRLISFMCRANQWDGLTESKINGWLNNFHDIEGQYYALKILNNCIYYSENDVIDLLRYGFYDLILATEIKKEIIKKKSITETPSIIDAQMRALRDKTLFLPLLDSGKPHESGLQFIRYLVQNQIINDSQTSFPGKLTAAQLDQYKIIVIVDDCIGSGQQISDYWDSSELRTVKKLAEGKGIIFYYLALVGYRERIDAIKGALTGLKVIVCEALTHRHRVFEKESIYWGEADELENAKKYFSDIQRIRGVKMLGHDSLDFAVIIHRNVPDWSLPIFWMKGTDWNVLLERKNSHV